MMNWMKEEAGRYVSENGRFRVSKTWDRSFGNHWACLDRDEEAELLATQDGTSFGKWWARERATHRFSSLKEAKEYAESVTK